VVTLVTNEDSICFHHSLCSFLRLVPQHKTTTKEERKGVFSARATVPSLRTLHKLTNKTPLSSYLAPPPDAIPVRSGERPSSPSAGIWLKQFFSQKVSLVGGFYWSPPPGQQRFRFVSKGEARLMMQSNGSYLKIEPETKPHKPLFGLLTAPQYSPKWPFKGKTLLMITICHPC